MKYIYYIIAIVVFVSGLTIYGMSTGHIKISEPYLAINDRVISKAEFDKMLKHKPPYLSREQFIQTIIDRQLLIQQALKMKINKEESFRRSIENFYEQSLINVLLKRKFNSISVDATKNEISRYIYLSDKNITITKIVYPNMKDAKNGTNGVTKKIVSDFRDMSDNLKFILLHLKKGKPSKPEWTSSGIVVYRLDDIKPSKETSKLNESPALKQLEIKRISRFIKNEKKAQFLKEWTYKIRGKAKIWRKDEQSE